MPLLDQKGIEQKDFEAYKKPTAWTIIEVDLILFYLNSEN